VPTFLLSEANPEGTGNANSLIINTKRLSVEDGGSISAGILNSVGEAGDIINSCFRIYNSFRNSPFPWDSQITILGSEQATNDAGNILFTRIS
jgi:hypothetical protein